MLIVYLAALFRLYGLNWDQGYHLHPDERAIVMFTTPLQFPKTISDFFSPTSSWNPHFFAYGSFPLYFLKAISNIVSGIDPLYAAYEKINLVGRVLSTIFDIGTLYVLFLLAKKLFDKHIGLLAAFFYAISVLPIQLSHFYAVDTPLTFFVLLTMYQLIRLYEKPTFLKSILVGFFFGLSLATKTSALVLIASIGMAIAVDFLLIFLRNPHKPHIWFPHLPKFIKRLLIDSVIIAVITCITFIIFEPYATIDFQTFWQQQLQQRQMTYDAFTFPYTLQYVGKIPYWYELKNIFLWGLGPLLGTFSFLGVFYFTFLALKKEKKDKWAQELILATFFFAYFFVVGSFAIGFMRYMLPLYPFLCLFAAVLVYRIFESLKHKKILFIILYPLFFILIFAWPMAFMHIYSKPNTRVLATDWINKNIPPGSIIATEHWDDGLPLGTQGNYKVLELPMYESDTPVKWEKVNQVLKETQYIIIASNRLYVPLQKMTNCNTLPPGRCYTQTATYYKNLFAENLGFQKVAEFSIYPTIPVFNISINDQGADESFTVYDHPKVMIFKKDVL